MIRSLVGRLTLLEQLTVIGAIVAFGLTSYLITAQVLKSERRVFVNSMASRLAAAYDDELKEEPDTLAAAQGVIEDGREAGVQVEIRDAAGGVLASSRSAPGADSSGARAPGITPAAGLFAASAVSRHGARITVAASDLSRRETLSALVRALLIAALPILALSLLLGRSIVVRALRPLSTMAERAAGMSVERKPRSLGARSGLEEIDRLANSFDRLLERLDDAMSAERRLTADASHELRTPLTVLGGELEMLLETSNSAPETDGLRRAAEQVGGMRELVEAILLLHRSGESVSGRNDSFEIINLCDLSREALAESLQRYPGREVDVSLTAPDEILVSGHGALLSSAVRNLMDNALKFTRAGNRVRIEVAAEATQAVLTVDDQGPGVREDERERIFDPFFRGAGSGSQMSGFGLGLPILRRVARAHGGDVEVLRSDLGGARFVLRLPRLGAEARL